MVELVRLSVEVWQVIIFQAVLFLADQQQNTQKPRNDFEFGKWA